MTSCAARHRKPRVLMVAPFCFPPRNAEAFVNVKLVEAMLDDGWTVDVITDGRCHSQYYPARTSAWERISSVAHVVREQDMPGRARALVDALRDPWPASLASIRWVPAAADRACALLASRRHDVVLSRSIPDDAHAVAWMVKRRAGVPWIANWNDPQPAAKLPRPMGGGADARLPRADAWLYRSVADGADCITFPCERLRRYMLRYLPGAALARTAVVPHVGGACTVMPPRRPGDDLVVLHAGDLHPPRSPVPLLDGLRRHLARHPESRMRVEFLTHDARNIAAVTREMGLSAHVRVRPGVSYDEVREVLAAADVLAIVEGDVEEGVFLPSKLVDYADVGRPILAIGPRPGTVADLLGAHGGGLSVDVRDHAAIADALDRIWTWWRTGLWPPELDGTALRALFAPAAIRTAYLELFERVSAFPRAQRAREAPGRVGRN